MPGCLRRGNNNNNDEYLECLTRTGPKRLHVLCKYIFVKIQCIQHECTHTRTHARTHARTHTHRLAHAVLAGIEIPGGGGRGRLYVTLHCHHRNDSCMKMGSDESSFNVLLIARDKITKPRPQTTKWKRRAESDLNQGPSSYQRNVLPLGQTGSLINCEGQKS